MGIYRLRKRWQQLMQALDREEHWGKFVFVRFFDWYAPFFAAYSFVLARANEYEADRCAAQATDPRHIADALIATHIKAGFLDERYWPNLSCAPSPCSCTAIAASRAPIAQKRVRYSTEPICVLGIVPAWWAFDDDYKKKLVKNWWTR